MKLLVDNQLPLLLVQYLRERGHECIHVLEIGLDDAGDLELWTLCLREGRVLVSKDEDFVFLSSRRRDTGRLIWVRLGNCRNTALIAAFERALDDLVHVFETGQRIVELR